MRYRYTDPTYVQSSLQLLEKWHFGAVFVSQPAPKNERTRAKDCLWPAARIEHTAIQPFISVLGRLNNCFLNNLVALFFASLPRLN
jgi:hypothetical protein